MTMHPTRTKRTTRRATTARLDGAEARKCEKLIGQLIRLFEELGKLEANRNHFDALLEAIKSKKEE